MPTSGKLELTIKINEMPADVETVENGWKQFDLDCDGQLVRVTVKPKVFKKLEQAQENYPMWVAAIAGKMGEPIEGGFVLDQPNIQTFERKPKEPKPETATV
ncbi:MAG: fertility inhibition FinO-like protein [Cyanobacteriota bacterium]